LVPSRIHEADSPGYVLKDVPGGRDDLLDVPAMFRPVA